MQKYRSKETFDVVQFTRENRERLIARLQEHLGEDAVFINPKNPDTIHANILICVGDFIAFRTTGYNWITVYEPDEFEEEWEAV